ncbi:MAG: VOC family protein [Christensenellales bacterium]|jgi:predicted enzyme related to lactoylglutathione lyase
MIFTDVCFITNDVLRLRAFYEVVFGGAAEGDEWHSTLNVGGLHMVFMLEKNSDFYYEFAESGNNTVLSFNVDDLDAEYERLQSLGAEMVNAPTTHSWGARSFQFRDSDGNILNFRSFPKEA